jgi:hypothetical protein
VVGRGDLLTKITIRPRAERLRQQDHLGRAARGDVLRENMILSMHLHDSSEDGRACLYMQDAWLVTVGGRIPLADLPMRIFDGPER